MPKKGIKRREEPGSELEKWKVWAKAEYTNEGKFWSNMVRTRFRRHSGLWVESLCRDVVCLQALVRAVGLFVGSVVVMRSFGDIIGVE